MDLFFKADYDDAVDDECLLINVRATLSSATKQPHTVTTYMCFAFRITGISQLRIALSEKKRKRT